MLKTKIEEEDRSKANSWETWNTKGPVAGDLVDASQQINDTISD